MNSKIKYVGMTLIAIAVYYLTIFVYCKVMNYYYQVIVQVFTSVSYAVSQTSTILIVLICGTAGAFILYQSQKSNKENIGNLVRFQLFITAIWFTIPIICALFCDILNVSPGQIPFLLPMRMVYVTLAIWVATTLCFIHRIKQTKHVTKENTQHTL
ncbi:MAG: hypothetical protein FWD52_09420 [Candidatus Bathyarchaeota archaeon]|nr:hypothetical protein [Candidatus Termiticorpusculum sp.]